MVAGRVIVLNGATSSGKSTLARALQRKLAEAGEPWFVIALDDFLGRVPPDWFRIGDHIGSHGEDGVVFEMVDGAIETGVPRRELRRQGRRPGRPLKPVSGRLGLSSALGNLA